MTEIRLIVSRHAVSLYRSAESTSLTADKLVELFNDFQACFLSHISAFNLDSIWIVNRYCYQKRNLIWTFGAQNEEISI